MPNPRKKLKKPGYVPSLATGVPVQHSRVVERDEPSAWALRHSEIAEMRAARYDTATATIKVSGLHNTLRDADKISHHAWEWADRHCKAVEIVDGGADGKSTEERVDGDRAESYFPRRVREATFLRISHARMTTHQRQIVLAACVYAWVIADVAEKVLLIPVRPGEAVQDYRSRVKSRVYRAVTAAIEAGAGDAK